MFSTCSECSFKFQIPTVATAISWDPQQFQQSTSNIKFRPFGWKFCDTVLFLLEEYWHKVNKYKQLSLLDLRSVVRYYSPVKGIHTQ